MKSGLQNDIGLGEEINQFGNAPTDIAQIADDTRVCGQADPCLEPASRVGKAWPSPMTALAFFQRRRSGHGCHFASAAPKSVDNFDAHAMLYERLMGEFHSNRRTMKLQRLAILVFLVLAGSEFSHAADIGWPEAVGRLAGERSKAETCIALMKRYGSEDQISRGRLTYADGKSSNDAMISGLITALTLNETPKSLQNLEKDLQSATSNLADFCNTVSDLVPKTPGNKSVLSDIVTAAIEPLLKALSDGVAALYNNHRDDDALIRKTIQTQLEAARWPDFAEVKAAE
jgi:hypothetical protein